jgi:type IV pilus assembly protein PilA
MTKKQKGFSLIELLIVVAIILIIAAIAIPNLIRARISANESSAVGSIRTINTAEVSYATTYPAIGFAAQLPDLGGASPCTAPVSTAACLIDDVLAQGTKSGYTFTAIEKAGSGTSIDPYTQYFSTAIAQSASSGQRAFCSDETGVIRYELGSPATACVNTDSPLQ